MRRSLTAAFGLALALLSLLLAGCQPAALAGPEPTAASPATPSPAPTTLPGVDAQVREAYRLEDPLQRRAAVLDATGRYLRAPSLQAVDDATASRYLTDAAFSSSALHLQDRAFIRREGPLAAVSLPDGLGLFLYDLADDTGSAPLELTRWTAGLSALDVTWRAREVGAAYWTLAADGAVHAHFVLAVRDGGGWRVAWQSDEDPDWWFNAEAGELVVAPGLARLTLSGVASGTTDAFYELEGEPRREFEVEWVRELSTYRRSPPVDAYPSRQAWLWATARPSPYASLVEFVERLQLGDTEGAGRLAAEQAVLDTALEFGLGRAERRYQVVESEGGEVTFRDLEGAYRAVLAPAAEPGAAWLLERLERVESG